MCKKMKPDEFKVGRRYRTDDWNYTRYIYTCVKRDDDRVRLERDGGFRHHSIWDYDQYQFEELSNKKRIFH